MAAAHWLYVIPDTACSMGSNSEQNRGLFIVIIKILLFLVKRKRFNYDNYMEIVAFDQTFRPDNLPLVNGSFFLVQRGIWSVEG